MKKSETKIKKLISLLDSAVVSLNGAREILIDVAGLDSSQDISKAEDFVKAAASLTGVGSTVGVENSKVVEGIFDGEKMIDSDGFSHPIPANYISKSKLVEGDGLKLTITDDGRFLYKQIRPVPRKHITGTLTVDGDQYFVIADGMSYKVILAAVTYFKASVGDRISIIVPGETDASWAAVDAVIPG